MPQDQESIPQPKRNRGDDRQVDRCDTVGRDCEGRSSQPCDGGRLLICNRGLADVDPKLEQFAVNPWRSPQQVGNAHLANDMAKGDTK